MWLRSWWQINFLIATIVPHPKEGVGGWGGVRERLSFFMLSWLAIDDVDQRLGAHHHRVVGRNFSTAVLNKEEESGKRDGWGFWKLARIELGYSPKNEVCFGSQQLQTPSQPNDRTGLSKPIFTNSFQVMRGQWWSFAATGRPNPNNLIKTERVIKKLSLWIFVDLKRALLIIIFANWSPKLEEVTQLSPLLTHCHTSNNYSSRFTLS